jgi:nucleoside-diphosphate-sugar epimerase
MKVVVTGATGNVGSAVVAALAARPEVQSITGIARRRPAIEVPKVAWFAADVGADPLDDLMRDADAVVHLAWQIQPQHDEAAMGRTNVVGTLRAFGAAQRSGVPAFVYASSVGTYAPGPKEPVDEHWPATGVPSSSYSRHKAAVEALVADAWRSHPTMRVVPMRTSLVFQRAAASEIGRLFLGPLVPRVLLRPGRLPITPAVPGLIFQATHARDVAAAYVAAVLRDVRGPFNIASDPVVDPATLATALEARKLPVPAGVLRAAVAVGWRARLVPIEAGWIDMALRTPVMDTTRARTELGWQPEVTAMDALRELFDGLAAHAGGETPPLAPAFLGSAAPFAEPARAAAAP